MELFTLFTVCSTRAEVAWVVISVVIGCEVRVRNEAPAVWERWLGSAGTAAIKNAGQADPLHKFNVLRRHLAQDKNQDVQFPYN